MASTKHIVRELWKAEEDLINAITSQTRARLRIFELRRLLAATPLYPEEEEGHTGQVKHTSVLLSEEYS